VNEVLKERMSWFREKELPVLNNVQERKCYSVKKKEVLVCSQCNCDLSGSLCFDSIRYPFQFKSLQRKISKNFNKRGFEELKKFHKCFKIKEICFSFTNRMFLQKKHEQMEWDLDLNTSNNYQKITTLLKPGHKKKNRALLSKERYLNL
jgi:hypothetical protein